MKTSALTPSGYFRHATFQRVVATLLMLTTVVVQAALVTVSSVTPDATGTELYVKYSTPLCASSAGPTYLPNYTIVGGAGSIVGATLQADQVTVKLDIFPALVGSQTLKISTSAGNNIIDSNCGTNALMSPVTWPFLVTGTLTVPLIVAATPEALGSCQHEVTLSGGGFSSTAKLTLQPGGIQGMTTYVSPGGTEITATFPGNLAPGSYAVSVNNPAGANLLPNKTSLPYNLPVVQVYLSTNIVQYASACTPTRLAFRGGAICDDPATTLEATPSGAGTPISATGIQVSPDGTMISGLFDFSSSSATLFSVTVRNPDGASATELDIIRISGPQMWGSLWPNLVGNCATKTVAFPGDFCPGDDVRLVANSSGLVLNHISAPFFTTVGPAFWTALSADFDFTSQAGNTFHAEFKRGVGAWKASTATLTVLDVSSCPLYVEVLGKSRLRFNLAATYVVRVSNLGCATVAGSSVVVTVPAPASPTFQPPISGGTVSPANVVTLDIPALAAGGVFSNSFTLSLPDVPNLNTTVTLTAVDSLSGCNPVSKPIAVVASADPNEKTGLVGTGANHAIAGNEVLPYEIQFENLRTASAPAQDVFVSDQLNPSQFDLATFSLGEMTFGDRVITPPPGLTSFAAIVPHDLDGDPATTSDQMLVVVSAALDANPTSANYGRVNWSYRTLDPATLETPADPGVGFLPPNIAAPVGEGSVKFTVQLKANLAPGAQMGSAAVVVFDANAPIYTNPWFNQITTTPMLVIRRNGDSVEIEWAGAAGVYTLQETLQLGKNVAWTTEGTTPVSIGGGLQRVTLAPNGDEKYFRLQRYQP